MKKGLSISFVFLIIVLLSVFAYWYNYSGEIISKDLDEIKNITVTVYPCDEEKKEIKTINDTYEIEELYNILNETTKIRNNRYPSHIMSVQWDPKFEINILYRNGDQDYIFSTEATGSVCKYLNSKGNSGDRGYRIGKNQAIWNYIFDMSLNK